VHEKVIANKVKLGPAEALAMARAVDDLYVARGKKLVHVRPRVDQPSDEELLALLLGPSGNLRAPALRVGNRLVIGFHPDALREALDRRR